MDADLHRAQLAEQEHANRRSAACILDILWDYLQPASALDVGFGVGIWLAALQSRGVRDVRDVRGIAR